MKPCRSKTPDTATKQEKRKSEAAEVSITNTTHRFCERPQSVSIEVPVVDELVQLGRLGGLALPRLEAVARALLQIQLRDDFHEPALRLDAPDAIWKEYRSRLRLLFVQYWGEFTGSEHK